MFVVKLYGFCLSIAYIVRQCHPYIESLPTLWLVEDEHLVNRCGRGSSQTLGILSPSCDV